MTQNDLRVVRETEPDSRLIDDLCDIYIESFPPSERVDLRVLAADIVDNRSWLFTARMAHNLMGFAVTTPLSGTQVHLLEYMAVAKEARSRGIGALLLQSVSKHAAQSSDNVIGCILEVESDDFGTEDEQLIRKRRIEFYLRNGVLPVTCAPLYQVPSFAGDDAILPMKLMWLPLNNETGTLSGRKLRDCICSIYNQSYGLSTDDPFVQSALNDLTC